jgi:hypothetical protein
MVEIEINDDNDNNENPIVKEIEVIEELPRPKRIEKEK